MTYSQMTRTAFKLSFFYFKTFARAGSAPAFARLRPCSLPRRAAAPPQAAALPPSVPLAPCLSVPLCAGCPFPPFPPRAPPFVPPSPFAAAGSPAPLRRSSDDLIARGDGGGRGSRCRSANFCRPPRGEFSPLLARASPFSAALSLAFSMVAAPRPAWRGFDSPAAGGFPAPVSVCRSMSACFPDRHPFGGGTPPPFRTPRAGVSEREGNLLPAPPAVGVRCYRARRRYFKKILLLAPPNFWCLAKILFLWYNRGQGKNFLS